MCGILAQRQNTCLIFILLRFINQLESTVGMELLIKEDSPKHLVFEVDGETHAFCNLLKAYAAQETDMSIVTYSVSHPLIAKPTFLAEGKNVKECLKEAASKAEKTFAKLEKAFAKVE